MASDMASLGERTGLVARLSGAQGERGSGTVAGLMLVVVAAVALTVVAAIGNVMLSRAKAASVADDAALAAANVLFDATGDPCARAYAIATREHATLASCVVEGEDVVVEVQIPTSVAVVRQVSQRSRAGPEACE